MSHLDSEDESIADESTKFKHGNGAWKARSSHGRKPIFPNPEALFEACLEYFQWVDDNPMMTAETVKFQGSGKLMSVPKMRAMTIVGLCNFLDINRSTWAEYRDKPDFSDICDRVEAVIFQQKFEGAAADMLNPSIVARELGLGDKDDSGDDGMVDVMRELARRLPD